MQVRFACLYYSSYPFDCLILDQLNYKLRISIVSWAYPPKFFTLIDEEVLHYTLVKSRKHMMKLWSPNKTKKRKRRKRPFNSSFNLSKLKFYEVIHLGQNCLPDLVMHYWHWLYMCTRDKDIVFFVQTRYLLHIDAWVLFLVNSLWANNIVCFLTV